MNFKIAVLLLALGEACRSSASTELSFQPVALSGQPAAGLPSGYTFNAFTYVALGEDGRPAFGAELRGPSVTYTNQHGVWAGQPLSLLARSGAPMPDQGAIAVMTFLASAMMDSPQAIALRDFFVGGFGDLTISQGDAVLRMVLPVAGSGADLKVGIEVGRVCARFNGPLLSSYAGRARLTGPGVASTNETAIVAGSLAAVQVVARAGSPAPGTSGRFTSFPLTVETVALTPSGEVAFMANSDQGSGLWFGPPDAVQPIVLPGKPVPESILGPGYTYGFLSVLTRNVEVNDRGEWAFGVSIDGPGLNDTNSEFVVAGPPSALRTVAQSGQPAPGIPGAHLIGFNRGFSTFESVLLGTEGRVAFVASYSKNGTNFGLWMVPSNTTPLLVACSGAQAPGTPPGVVFASPFLFLSPFTQVYLNARGQLAFGAKLAGLGIGNTNDFGIWLAESDGAVSLVIRSGVAIETTDGRQLNLQGVSFGRDALEVAGPQNGHRWRSPFNSSGEIACQAYWKTPPGPPSFGSVLSGVFVARSGMLLNAERHGDDLHLSLPTLVAKAYRVDYSTNLAPPVQWFELNPRVLGTGGPLTVTDTNSAGLGQRFYRSVRLTD